MKIIAYWIFSILFLYIVPDFKLDLVFLCTKLCILPVSFWYLFASGEKSTLPSTYI